MKTIYRILLTLNSTSLVLFVYMIKGGLWIEKMGAISIAVYVLAIVVFTNICIFLGRILKKDSIEGDIQDISMANDNYLPSYLGYFFVALSIPDGRWLTFWTIFLIICIFTYSSHTLYFNPLFLLFGYNFYYLSTKKRVKIFVISKQRDIRNEEGVSFMNLRKINEFTYVDMEGEK